MILQNETVDLTTPSGPMRTYVYRPHEERRPTARYPGIVFYSEIFQQTPPIRRLAEGFAAQGFVVMVPEVYHLHEPPGTVLGYDDVGKEKGNSYKSLTPLGTFDDDARAALEALKKHPSCNGKLGAAGVCLGGHLAFRAALNPEVRACVCCYPTDLHTGTLGTGANADSLQRAGDIHGELLMIWGRQDPHIPYEGRRTILDALHQASAWFTWHEFNGEHAFLRDEGARYDPAIARQAMGLAFDLFHRVLGADDATS
jgi:carboxymethylenebutenolidase